MSLVLSRKYAEAIVITASNGEQITVTIQEIRGDKVKLRCNGPAAVTIHRAEIQAVIDAESIEYDPTIGEDYA
jgi:carbon storage regulator CsrA